MVPRGQFEPNDVLEQAAGVMLDELERLTRALAPLREEQKVTA